MKATFDGDLDKLMFFLNQVWAHLDHYPPVYPLDMVMVNAVTANLDGEAVEWMTKLHNEDAPEFCNTEAFMVEPRVRFEDESQALQAKAEI